MLPSNWIALGRKKKPTPYVDTNGWQVGEDNRVSGRVFSMIYCTFMWIFWAGGIWCLFEEQKREWRKRVLVCFIHLELCATIGIMFEYWMGWNGGCLTVDPWVFHTSIISQTIFCQFHCRWLVSSVEKCGGTGVINSRKFVLPFICQMGNL